MLYQKQDLRRMLAPLMVEQVLAMLVGMVDTMMVSSSGEAAVSGVALVDMVNYLIITVMAALTTGGAVVISQYLGREQPERAAFSAGQLAMVSALLSTGIMALGLVLRQGILRLFFGAVEPPVMEAALTYFVITACSFPFLGIYNAGAALYRVLGRTSVTMYISLGMNLINLVGDLYRRSCAAGRGRRRGSAHAALPGVCRRGDDGAGFPAGQGGTAAVEPHFRLGCR